jgi:hypothetical protein
MHARGLERFQVLDLKSPISGSAGDYDRAGTDAFIIGQFQDKVVFIGIAQGLKADHLIRDRHLDSKLLGLVVSAPSGPCR